MSAAAAVAAALAWALDDPLPRSRLLWRLTADGRLEPPWPYAAAWWDPAGAVLLDLTGHPSFGASDPPWLQLDGADLAAAELLAAVRLPAHCEVLLPTTLGPAVAALGQTSVVSRLEVLVCPPGALGDAALPYPVTRLTPRHRALVAADDWRPEDLAAETDEERAGTRWAILRHGQLVSGLLVQRIGARLAELADVHTRPEYRRRGYGAALVQGVVRRLHERGITATYSVHPDNLPSRALAAAIGFQPLLCWERRRLDRV
ncbi:MAG: GNAT family N-acetyltransferase [Fimbriimonadaceae bacterium]|nr:GNAT family N-acetyltransferase [Fimbriimonadaceae bacterium]